MRNVHVMISTDTVIGKLIRNEVHQTITQRGNANRREVYVIWFYGGDMVDIRVVIKYRCSKSILHFVFFKEGHLTEPFFISVIVSV